MTYKDLKIATLQKLFAIPGSELVSDDTTATYIAGMPQAANEALQLLSYQPVFTDKTADDYLLPLKPEEAVILPLYMASQLYKDDEPGVAVQYRNEFEAAREHLKQSASRFAPAKDQWENTKGWY